MSVSLSLYCRFCAEQKSAHELTDVKSDQYLHKEIVEKLSIFNSISVDFSINTLPGTVCIQCIQMLNSTHEFFTKIKMSQLILTTLKSTMIKPYLQGNDNTYDSLNKCMLIKSETLENDEFKLEFDDNSQLYDEKCVSSLNTWSTYPWVCKHCDIQVESLNALREHSKETHNICFALKCADCNNILVDKFEDFINHIKGHRIELRHYCQYCNYKFEDHNTVIHLSQHLHHQCEKCGESFPTPHTLRSHIKTYKVKKIKRKRKKILTQEDLTCDVCQKVAKSLNKLQAHKVVHTDRKREYTCDRCGMAFFTKGALIAHKVIHEDKVPEVCEICKKTFLTITRLKKHVKTHYAVKNFLCDVCQKSFRLKDQLKSHMVCHSNVMPFSCQFCEKTFRFRNVLKTHENQHTGVRPYSCSVCPMDFANWSNCNKHMLRRHGATIAKSAMTPQGKLPISPDTGQLRSVMDLKLFKDWTEKILEPSKRGRKT